ncbi:Fur family transcriptional regulator [Raineyella sp. LH-20]|uniref:Fur family transcriptional regulator n=1 Tax=Raineyella sp. LH-20 TaxID=3081204 RepID=UPI002954D986|nr:Fur family transcriptional regulator [Raineyella sp. LH-20]WOP17718.1 Fur family transcriptional regulator [Raineyella sp. LH-20]
MTTSSGTSVGEWQEHLHRAGLRVTPGRLATLTHLEAHPHSSVAEILTGLTERFPTLSVQSITNITRDLAAGGLVRRVDLPASTSARYETRVHDNHHHIQCVVCGRIEDLDCVIGQAPCLTPSQTHGMRVLEAQVTFRGVCSGCETALADAAAADGTPPVDPATADRTTPTGRTFPLSPSGSADRP